MYYRGSQDEPLLYVSPFLWGCHEAMERWWWCKLAPCAMRRVLDREQQRADRGTRTMETVPSPKLQYSKRTVPYRNRQ